MGSVILLWLCALILSALYLLIFSGLGSGRTITLALGNLKFVLPSPAE